MPRYYIFFFVIRGIFSTRLVHLFEILYYKKSFLSTACLRHLNDPGNAYLSLEKSTMLPDAIKNPLIYLNFALYCYEIGKPDQSVSYLANFLEMTQHISVHREVSIYPTLTWEQPASQQLELCRA